MLKELIKLASELDSRGLTKEADALDKIIKLSGRRVVEKIGDVKIYKDSDWGEYVVVPKGATPTCDSAYHTDDMEDAVDTARSMDKKDLNKEAASTYQMVDNDIRKQKEDQVAGLLVAEAKRRANRDDIPKEMYEEYFYDAVGDVGKLIDSMVKAMEIYKEPLEEDEPTELVEDSSKYSSRKPWDALFPPS